MIIFLNPRFVDKLKNQTVDILNEIKVLLRGFSGAENYTGRISHESVVRIEKIFIQAKEIARIYLDKDSTYYEEIIKLTKAPSLFNLKSLAAPFNVLHENLIKNYISIEKIKTSTLKFDKIIDQVDLNDSIYQSIIDDINGTYCAYYFTSMFILIRKLLENLVYDCLKLYYGLQNSPKFFNTRRSQHHNFGTLYDNFKSMIKEQKFITLVQKIDPEYIQTLNEFKEKGNIHAHSVFGYPHQDFIEERKQKINLLIGLLNQVKNNLSGNTENEFQ